MPHTCLMRFMSFGKGLTGIGGCVIYTGIEGGGISFTLGGSPHLILCDNHFETQSVTAIHPPPHCPHLEPKRG